MQSITHTNRTVRTVSALATAVAFAVLLSACTPLTVAQASFTAVNTSRQTAGKSQLLTLNGTTAANYAQAWADKLAAAHPEACQVTYPAKPGDGAPTGWKAVGMAAACQQDQGSPTATADAMQKRFMVPGTGNDTVILGNYTHLGTGATKTPSGSWYIVYYFVRL